MVCILYIIRSINHPDQEYTGASEDLKQRIKDHNSGKSTHTAKFAPWELLCIVPSLINTKPSNLRNI